MRYQIVGKNVTITEAMRNAVLKKMERFEKYFDAGADVRCTVTVSTTRLEQTIEISIMTKHMNFRVKVSAKDFYAALDISLDHLDGQLRKMKTQLDRTKKKSLAENIRLEMLKDSAEDEESISKIVRRKRLSLTPMDVDEALTRMDALDHSFFIYLDSETGLVSVLYSRQDGGYGVIEVEE